MTAPLLHLPSKYNETLMRMSLLSFFKTASNFEPVACLGNSTTLAFFRADDVQQRFESERYINAFGVPGTQVGIQVRSSLPTLCEARTAFEASYQTFYFML
jgi:hypothetical protein